MGTMNEAVSSAMNKDGSMAEAERHVRLERGYKRVSDAVAYGLLVYTALQIFMTMHAVESEEDTMLPTFALVVLVAAIIPLYRRFEKRWETRAPADRDTRPFRGGLAPHACGNLDRLDRPAAAGHRADQGHRRFCLIPRPAPT
jgi:hypothetical protein